MANQPLISVVIPTYNRLNTLLRAIDSVKIQTYKNWEILIIDDKSDDGTKEKLEEMQKNDERIRYFRVEVNDVPGISKYLNYGIKQAKGKYIARLDDDDFWCFDDKLKMQVNFLEKNPEYILVGGGMIIIDENGKEKFKYFKNEKDNEIRKKALMSNPFTHAVVMFRKDVAESIGGYKNFKHVEDWDFWLRLGKEGKLYNFQEYFGKYLSSGENLSFIHQRRQTKIILEIIKLHKKDYPNYWKGYIINFTQYIYSCLPIPISIRKRVQSFGYYIKRKYL